ncbi:hypothetical protein COW36_17600 [bacterium (Candidatus Blackallbacteria) CG17_big_fil_post_rev_8_21_14_2_50_48_46]|uniref:DUF4870 domain-containing protein n=1 Tax=bacterium (Candidatus Blackallbacteria) CG17_big_fil_post_rev_8_21_14_2_50_48_46 TaxID=2014261 RepID=A0A2M7G0T2_9BACT|nr:MAG: hypothetical protein COW64_01125 [bacterium (Candidatus Blackallbacteria) CG18_big_fil_WC_8_21_14_2_50_49_26]PIW15236.1 MAG: hypothetical protein COW36_17600 [bacterium (Candidatus Blackallbacteria) CG17_big_fil_post_rev_8_21_14_2_50_48_46]PIW45256.1 MAG: hypothetical protein COW20_21415 [bacterium (Candidatus Blackallbacteria) CG13_big_fil_rev_8_21_14_2_50_49_14]
MRKDEFLSHEELTVAAAGYLPPFWAVLLLFKRWRLNYFTRYHLIHAALLSLANLLILLLTGLFSLLMAKMTGFSFILTMITGNLIALSLLVTAGFIAYCALNATRGRYTVIPGLSQLYYAVFSQRPDSSPDALIRHHQQHRASRQTSFRKTERKEKP